MNYWLAPITVKINPEIEITRVAKFCNISVDAIKSKCRKEEYKDARHLYLYRIYKNIDCLFEKTIQYHERAEIIRSSTKMVNVSRAMIYHANEKYTEDLTFKKLVDRYELFIKANPDL
jgi:hypothetical protein